jgi:Bacterial Ig domain
MSLAVADVDASGHPRILAGVDGSGGPRLEAIDGATGARLWHTAIPSPSGVLKIKAADMNHDGHDDIVVHVGSDFQNGAEIYIVDGSTHNAAAVAATSLSAFEVIDINGDAIPELALAHVDGSIDVLDVGSGSILHHYHACAADPITIQLTAIAVDKLSSASPGDVLYTCGSHVAWMSLTSGASEVITDVIANQVGVGNNLLSFGTDAASDRIVVGSYVGVTHLGPVNALAPYVDPGNSISTNVFSGHWAQPFSNQITFGTFDGVSASLELVSGPTHGKITMDGATGEFTYTGAAPFKGTDYFVVRARTAAATSAPTTVPLVLANSPPSLASTQASVMVQAGSSVSVNLSPTDIDQGDTLTLLIVQTPTQGTIQFNGDLVVYTANAGSSGSDTFAVKAFDQLDYSAPMVVSVSIQAATSAPPPTNPPPTTPASSGGGGGAINSAFLLALLLMLGARRRGQQCR